MLRKKSSCFMGVVFILIVLLAVSTAFGMVKQEEKKSADRVKIGQAPLMKLAGAEKNINPITPGRDDDRISLGVDAAGASLSPGLTVGITTYDYQHNCRMNRQVDWRGTQDVHFDWMVQSDYVQGGDRGTAYEAWDATFADLVFKGPDGGTDVHPRLGGGVNYSGYVGLDVGTDGRVICVCHHNEGASYASTVWPDFSVLGGFFSPNQDRIPTTVSDYDASDTSQFIWPNMEWQVIGDDTVCHVMAEESLDGINPQKLHYFRRVGGYTVGTWDDPPIVVDTVACITGTVTASRVSQKVAIVWTANPDFDNPGSTESTNLGLQRTNDLFYRMSTDMGQTFGPNVNVTGWDSSRVDWALHGDISALIDTEDRLHIIYDARETSQGFFSHFYGCRLFHWGEGQSIRVIKDANWDLPSTGTSCHGGAWNEMSIVKMQISECDGKLYALFVQFNDIANGIDDDCHNRAFVNSEASGTANGELYISISDNDGLNWDIARNLTNSYTAQCDSSPALGGTLECDSDMWPSMARFGMEVTSGDFSGVPIVDPSGEYAGNYYLDVLYINDKHPGGAVQDAGIWTTNPVKWFRVPCVEPIPNPVLVITPSYIGDPTWTKPGIQLDTTIRLENIGNAPLHISSISVVELDCPHGWLGYFPEITTVSQLEPNYEDMTVNLNLNGVLTTDGIGVSGLLIFESDSPTSPDTFNIDLIVADSVQRPEHASIRTDCKPLYVSNYGLLGYNGSPGSNANDWGNMQFYDDCDTTNNATAGDDDIACYLYESAPFILWENDDGDTVLATSIFDANWLDEMGFRPTEGLTVDSSGSDYQYANSGVFLTRDSLLALESEIFAPIHPDTCSFMVQRIKVYSNGVKRKFENIFIGELMDWDIPSDSGVENGSDWDASRQLMYCYGAEYGADSIPNNDCILADQRYGGFSYYAGTRIPHTNPDAYNTDSFPDIRGIWTHMNPDWIEPTGNFVPSQLYEKMVTFGGYEKWQSTNPALEDSLYQDLNMVAVFGEFDIDWMDTLVFVKIFSTSRTGLATLQTHVDMAKQWIANHNIFTWPPLASELPPAPPMSLPEGDINLHFIDGYRPADNMPDSFISHVLYPEDWYCDTLIVYPEFDNGTGKIDSGDCVVIDSTGMSDPSFWRIEWTGPIITTTGIINPNDTLYLNYWAYPGAENPDVADMTDIDSTYWLDATLSGCYPATYFVSYWNDADPDGVGPLTPDGIVGPNDTITVWNAATMTSGDYLIRAYETGVIGKEIVSELPEPLPEGNYHFDNRDGYRPPDGDPVNTVWHELYPVYCRIWTANAWADLDINQKLSATDSLYMEKDSETSGYLMKWIGPTIVTTPVGTPSDSMFLNYVMRDACTGLEKGTCHDNPDVNPIDSAIGTYWQEVSGDEDIFFCVGWQNNTVPVLDSCDKIIVINLSKATIKTYHVVGVMTGAIADGPVIENCCLAHGLAGDANSDGAINLLDILQTIQFVYQDPVGDPPNPNGCNALLDCNGDGPSVSEPTINLLDILATIQHVYQDPVGDPVLCCPPGCLIP